MDPRDPNNTAVLPLLYTVPVAARMLAISERKLWQLTKDGDIQVVNFGRSVRYRVDDLVAWIDANTKR